MKYQKSNSVSGKWIKGSDVISGSRAKLVEETRPIASQFKNKDGSTKMQDVSKIQFETGEPLNINVNRASINALIEAYGDDSAKWQGHMLTVETEKMRVGGKAVVVVYLIPDGFKKMDDANGYAVIVRDGTEANDLPEINLEEEIKPEDLPF